MDIMDGSAGVSAGIAPLYFAEISPESWKGAVGTIYQLVVVIAILFSQILGLDSVLGTDTLWPFLLGKIPSPEIQFNSP